jgi:hypothetical protein
MFAIIKAALVGGVLSFIAAYAIVQHQDKIGGHLAEFISLEEVRETIEDNIDGSGVYVIPRIASQAKVNKNIPARSPAQTPDLPNEVVEKPAIPQTEYPHLLVVMAVQEEGLPLDGFQKLAILLLIQIFSAFMIATMTSLSRVSHYLFHVLLNTFGGAMQVLSCGLVLVLYLGFPFQLLFNIAETVMISWLIGSIGMAIWTRCPKGIKS